MLSISFCLHHFHTIDFRLNNFDIDANQFGKKYSTKLKFKNFLAFTSRL